jgi:hypothetical protein
MEKLLLIPQYSTFMDAAGKPDHGPEEWCVVAGFISTGHRWDEFARTWNGLLELHQIPYLQMSALHARKRPYLDSKWEDPEYMASFLSEAGKIVENHVLGWGADAIKNSDFTKAVNERPGLARYSTAYGLCGSAVALRLQERWLNFERPNPVPVEHFFEEGDDGISNIEQVFARCGMMRPVVKPGKPRKDDPALHHYVQFQPADWLAFETRRIAKRYYPDKPVIRRSLQTLLRNMPGRAAVWTYDDLIKFCDVKRLRGQME